MAVDNPVFVPPFVGSRIVKGLSIDEIAEYVNETALFRNQWQYRPEAGENDDAFKARIRPQLRGGWPPSARAIPALQSATAHRSRPQPTPTVK